MPEEKVEGCVSTAEGPIVPKKENDTPSASSTPPKEETMSVMVGHEAPDFGATAFHEGGFKTVKLSDFRGKWVFLCFYPGDFTFV